jgi:hypothetical protein
LVAAPPTHMLPALLSFNRGINSKVAAASCCWRTKQLSLHHLMRFMQRRYTYCSGSGSDGLVGGCIPEHRHTSSFVPLGASPCEFLELSWLFELEGSQLHPGKYMYMGRKSVIQKTPKNFNFWIEDDYLLYSYKNISPWNDFHCTSTIYAIFVIIFLPFLAKQFYTSTILDHLWI